MKFLFYILLLSFPLQAARGQNKTDSIVFHGNIVNDGIANWYNSLERDGSLPPHFIGIKNKPETTKYANLYAGDTQFSIRCARGDTLVLSCSDFLTYPFSYKVEFIAHTPEPRDIHVRAYPATTGNWYYNGEKYKTGKLPPAKHLRSPALPGTYKHIQQDFESENFSESTLQLHTDQTFEQLSHGWSYDYGWTDYYTGKWEINKDTLICRVLPGLYPPLRQERYPGQVLSFHPGWIKNIQEAKERPPITKFLIRRRGLIASGYRKKKYKKVKISAPKPEQLPYDTNTPTLTLFP